MARSVLEIVNEVVSELGQLDEFASIATSSDPAARQLRAILNATGRELLQLHEWQQLLKQASFTTKATEVQVDSIKDTWPDLLYFTDETFFDRNQNRIVYGALSEKGYQRASASVTTTADYYFTVRGDQILMIGDRNAGNQIFFNYSSKNWLQSSDASTTYDAITNDTDVPILDDEALRLGTLQRYKSALGLEYGENYRAYLHRVDFLRGRNKPRPAIRLNPPRRVTLGTGFVPDGNFPG